MTSRSTSSMAQLNSTFDEENYDSFFDLNTDSNTYTPASASPAPGSSIPSFASSSSSFGSNHPQQVFPAPTFQYDAYKQQTGLPVGGLANTFAVSNASGLQFNYNSGFVMPTETLNIPTSKLTDFNFARSPSLPDMDYENESSADMPAMFYHSGSSSNFVEPRTLSSQDDSPTYSAPVQRMYPGMHAQQAAQAKAKQEESIRQQQQPRQIPGQRPLPSQLKTSPQKDPHVEESISRLLNQMRQNSVASVDDEDSTPTESGSGSRIKKDEDDMDEDERLLASEEGKKLTSKERRQLRNKVSARAFRSRRKEYIGQLEGEVAVKAQECNDLKVQNRQLMEENTRLTDLTKMLLSSSAFSTFLTELSASGLPAPQIPSQAQQAPRPQSTRKDVNPHQASRQMHSQQPQIGMALVPETSLDLSMLERPTNGWTSRLSSNDFQVFSVSELPEGPILDITKMSEKPKTTLVAPKASATKKDSPKIEYPVCAIPEKPRDVSESKMDPDVKLDENTFSLYFEGNRDQSRSVAAPENWTSSLQVKASSYLIAVDNSECEEDLAANLENLCAALDVTCERVAMFTSHF